MIFKIVWPYKDPFAALKNDHLSQVTWPYKNPFSDLEKKTLWPYNRTNAEEDLLQKSYFFDQKILKLFLAKKKSDLVTAQMRKKTF